MNETKRLWTSYYGAYKRLPPSHVQVRISRTAPRWWVPAMMMWEPRFAPNDAVWAVRNVPEWEERYLAQLKALEISGELASIVKELPENAVLLCWESSPIGCHRTTLAQFITQRGLAVVMEYDLGKNASNGCKRVLV